MGGLRHDGAGLWPPPDDLAADLDRHNGAPWLDETARRGRDVVLSASPDRVVDHGDWES